MMLRWFVEYTRLFGLEQKSLKKGLGWLQDESYLHGPQLLCCIQAATMQRDLHQEIREDGLGVLDKTS